MAVLKERRVWVREVKPARPTSPANRLSPEQQKNVLAALRRLYVQHGTWLAVAKAMGIGKNVMTRISRGTDKPSAGIAMAAGVESTLWSVGELLEATLDGARP